MSALSNPDPRTKWNDRYSEPGFAFGSEPNAWLAGLDPILPRQGTALSLAEGQGRNAVWLAQRGLAVTAVDIAEIGLAKAAELAASRGVPLTCVHADLAGYAMGLAQWDVIVSICCHLPPALRRAVHANVVAALKPGGLFVMEAYTPAQTLRETGGPRDPELCPTAELLRQELAGLVFETLHERVRPVLEGRYHTGEADVVDVLARKPL